MQPPLPFIEADAIRAAVPIGDMVDAVEAAYRDVAAGRDRSPLRAHHDLDGGSLLAMPGIRAGGRGATVKLVTVMNGNAARGLPTVQAVVVWFDAVTGTPRAILDGGIVTAMRTGAASGVATRLLARPDAASLAILGVGGQAEWQVRAVCAVRPIRRVVAFARTPAAREQFARSLGSALGIEVVPADSAESAVRQADVVCCATTSETPVFEAAWLRDGTHVNGVGAFRLGMVELPPALFARAAIVAVDALAAARAEAGDLVAAAEAGTVDLGDVVEIGTLPAGHAAERDPAAITVFKSVGLAIQDVAAAELIVERVLGRS